MTEQTKILTIPKYQQIKYFISSLNTNIGHFLVKRIDNRHSHPQNPHRIVGTLAKNGTKQITNAVRKVIDTEKITFLQEIILNSDVIIYDLTTCDPKQAQFAISTLKLHKYQEQKILICISNVMSWAKTAPKIKRQGQQQEGDDNPLQQPDSQQQGAAEPQGQEKKTYIRFTDKDYPLRRPSPNYQTIKSLQTLCLAAGNIKPNLKTYVVCSGLLYGQGEDLLASFFQQARLQVPTHLQVLGKGKNRIPMVHIEDLITYIQKIVQKKPKIPYLLAIDQNPKPTQKKIIQAISKGIGTGHIKSVPYQNGKYRAQQLSLNLRMKPTMIFAKIQQQQAAIEVQQGSQVVKFKFGWRSKQGIQKNIQLLRKQYIKAHGLKQQKVFIMGPPGCGKTYQAKLLAAKYNLPHIHIKGVINEIKQLKNQFGQQIKNFLNQKKQNQIQTKQAQYEELKQKWKKIPKDQRQPLPPFDPQKVDVRLSQELVYKCFKWRLTQNDCINRGYILDSYPRTYEDAKQLFMIIPPVAEGQQADQNAKKIIDERTIPQKLIVLQMSDNQILQRIQSLPQEKIQGTHLTHEKIKPLLQRYRKLHNSQSGEYVVQDFFKQSKIDCHHVRVSAQTQALLQSLVRRVQDNEQLHRKQIEQRLKKQQNQRKIRKQQLDGKQKIVRDIQNQDYMMKKQNQQNQQRQILDKKSLALRKYLDANLVPILSQGIADILKKFPKDPVDTLAQFLFRNSLKVPHPDPSTFEF